ncbi:hypothetical protein PHISP_07128, partial [Aspergillus sp. HF37]
DDDTLPLDLSPLPLRLQQLLLNTFKRALLPSSPNTANGTEPRSESETLDLAPLIQRLKTHLYNRDFASAFTDAGEDALRAYALRWSAGRALGYAGVFRGVFGVLPRGVDDGRSSCSGGWHKGRCTRRRVVCVGGGGGAEIGALAAVWRDLAESGSQPGEPGVSVVAVDVADWSGVVRRLDASLHGADVAASATATAALVHAGHAGTQGFRVGFRRADVLDLSDGDIGAIFGDEPAHSTAEAEEELESTALVTLMFTLNELFSTSMAKATGFLLRMTDSLQPGAVLLVVDSPGSYSTLRLGKGEGGEQERRYPMKFLLDHALLSVARGKWERVFAQESRWWRRDAARLRYDVGPGAGLEDMRFQIHVYRRVGR